MKHVLRSQQFDRQLLDTLFLEVDEIVTGMHSPLRRPDLKKTLKGRSLCIHFYVPSLRTSHSFEFAGRNLGMDVISAQSAGQFSANITGERLEESVRVLAGYGADVIAIRHTDEGGADRAATIVDATNFPTHIINAGDGTGQHVTQSLIDLYALSRLGPKRDIDGLTILIAGNLAFGRTVKSLAFLLARCYKVKEIIFLSPRELAVHEGIQAHLHEHGIQYRVSHDPAEVLHCADIIYWTNFHDGDPKPVISAGPAGTFSMVLNPVLMNRVQKHAIVLHPLPIRDEIETDAKSDPRMRFYEQSDFSVPVRMALLMKLFGKSVS